MKLYDYPSFCDIKRYYPPKYGVLGHLYRCYFIPSYRIVWLFRFVNNRKGLVRKMLSFVFLHEKTKSFISIYLGTKVKPGLLFPHGGPININPAVEIGENVIIHPNTLLGGNRKTGAPIIGDNVFIGNGAKLIGRIHVGNWVFISPGAVLTHDVPDDTVVGAGLNYFLRPQGGRIAVERYMKLQE